MVLLEKSIANYTDLRSHISLRMKTPSEVQKKASWKYQLAS